jgi:RNA polymerase sigma-70 factor, ECF subfamily
MRVSPARTGFTAWVETLAREQTDALVATAVREGLANEDAMDAVREAFATFLVLPQARSLAEHREDAATLLAVIVRDAARAVAHRHRVRPPAALEAQPVVDDSPSVATLIAAAEQHIVMLGCVGKLAEIQRAVIMLRVIEEVSSGAAAQQLGLTKSYLAVLLHRAKAALQACMAE